MAAAMTSATAAMVEGTAKLPVASRSRPATSGPAICPTPNPAVMSAEERRPCSGASARAAVKPRAVMPMKVPPSSPAASSTPAGVCQSRLHVWERLLTLVQEQGVQLGMTFLDGTSIRAHQKAAGAAKTAARQRNGTIVRHLAGLAAAMAPRLA